MSVNEFIKGRKRNSVTVNIESRWITKVKVRWWWFAMNLCLDCWDYGIFIGFCSKHKMCLFYNNSRQTLKRQIKQRMEENFVYLRFGSVRMVMLERNFEDPLTFLIKLVTNNCKNLSRTMRARKLFSHQMSFK